MASPIFQATNVVGGFMMAAPILPAQLAGGGLQLASVVASASISFVRVRNYMKTANATIFAPRGLTAKIMSTKKMMAAIGFTDTDCKGKLKLPPLNDLNDLNTYTDVSAGQNSIDGNNQVQPDDPRMRRLRALEGYISPCSFDVPAAPIPDGWLNKIGTAPLRWVNNRRAKEMDKARGKSLEKRLGKAPEVESEMDAAQREMDEIERKMIEIHQSAEHALSGTGAQVDSAEYSSIETWAESELKKLESAKAMELERRDKAIAEIYKSGDKKLEKISKKEQKVANRILWIVIMRADGSAGDELLDLGTLESQ